MKDYSEYSVEDFNRAFMRFMKLSHTESSRSNRRLLFIRRSGWVRKIINT